MTRVFWEAPVFLALTVAGLSLLLDAALKGVIVLALAGTLCAILRRASAASRHLVWCVALAHVVAMPLLSLALPGWQLPILPAALSMGEPAPLFPSSGEGFTTGPRPGRTQPAGAPSGKAPGSTRMRTVPSIPQVPAPGQVAATPIPGSIWVALVWLLGALLAIAPVLIGILSLVRIARRARLLTDGSWAALLESLVAGIKLGRRVTLRQSEEVSVPMTWGLQRPTILLPAGVEQWPEERRHLVLRHELAHIQRADCLTQVLAQVACAVYWFNPLTWLAARQLRVERERACDDRVLLAGARASDYAQHLLEIARSARGAGCASLAAVAMARPSQLEGRLLAVLDADRPRRAIGRWTAVTAVVAGLGAVLPLAAMEAPARSGESAKSDAAVAQGARSRLPREMMARRVWAGPGVDLSGTPSRDGRYLSFIDWDTGDLAIRDLGTGKNRRLTNKGSWSASPEYAESSRISPDGKQVAYAWMNQSNSFYELRLIGLNGSRPRVLYHHPEVQWLFPMDWSRDGKQILALFWKNGEIFQIALVSVADGSARSLKTLEWRSPGKPTIGMALSPDGRTIAYHFPAQAGTRELDIFLLAADGSGEVPLVQHPANDFVIGWAPDGRSLLFASDRTGSLGAWRVRLAERRSQGSPELVKREIGAMSPLGLTRSGSLYYGLRAGLMDVYTATLDPSTGQLLALPQPVDPRRVGSNSAPAWSPDGRYLAYRSPVSSAMLHNVGSHIVSIRSVESGQTRELALNVTDIHDWLCWSPGPFLMAGGDDRERRGVFRIDTQTGAVAGIPKTVGPMWHAVCAPEGKAIFYMKGSGKNSYSLCARDLETGQEKDLYRASSEMQNLALSLDGRQLAFSEPDRGTQFSVLKVMPSTGGEPRELLRVQRPETIKSIAWMPDGRHVLYARGNWKSTDPRTQETEVWRIPVSGGVPQRVGLAMNRLRDLCVHPDGRRVAFTAGEPEIEIWVMENFLPPAQSAKASAAKR
jgi:beta-lactamase regulating signal transducer with metallopeptidase domain/Tol biopolymer transport system component